MAFNVTNMVGGNRRVLVIVAMLAALGYVAVAVATDAGLLLQALRQLGWIGCGLVLTLSVVNYLLRFFRWQGYISKLGREVPAIRHLIYYLSGFTFTVSPGKIGEAVRSVYLKDHGVTYSESIAALFVERLLDLFAMVVLASLIVFDHATYRPLVFGVMIAVVALLIVLCYAPLSRWLTILAEHSWGRRFAGALATLNKLLNFSQRLLRLPILTYGIVIGIIAWGAEGVGLYLICQGLDLDIGVTTATGIYALSALVGTAAFFLPGGIGGMEIAMTSLLVSQGADLRVAIVATLLCRLATLWFAVILGGMATATLEIGKANQKVSSTP